MVLLGVLAALAAAGCCGVIAFQAASRLLRGSSVVVRAAAGGCLGYWLAAWVFEALALIGRFRMAAVAPLCVLLPLVLLWRRRGSIRATLREAAVESRAEVLEVWRELRRHPGVTVGLGLVGIHLMVRMARNLATPAFGWDDFTYHLFRAGRWVQNGGLQLEPAPDAWTYYEFFPWGGDLIWAWALVWGAGDVLVPIAAITLWCAVLLVAYAVARELGQEPVTALIVALALAVLPSQASQMSTAYVDNAVLVMVLVTSLFILILGRQTPATPPDPDLATPASFMIGVACGLGVMVKLSFLPMLIPAGVIVGWRALRSRRWSPLFALSGGFVVVVPNLAFNWVHRGSPFYPFRIVEWLPYNEQWVWTLGKYGAGATPDELTRAAKALVMNLFPLDPFLNMGWSGVGLVTLGLAGSVVLLRSARGGWYLLWALSGALLTIVNFFSRDNSSMVAFWTIVMSRFLVAGLAALMMSSGLAGAAAVRRLLLPVMLVEYFVYARRKWPVEVISATLQLLVLVALVVFLTWGLARWKRRPVPVWVGSALLLAVILVGAIGVRERLRFDAYRLFAERQMYDFHGAPYVEAWPIWQRVEEAGASRVAATAGYDGWTGHNWFRWPLLGAWLQNDVTYLPVTPDGDLVSYFDPERLRAAADRAAWLARVRDERIDWIAALGPASIEHEWILALPEIFPVEIRMGEAGANRNLFLLARVDHEALEGLLSRTKR